MITVKKLVLAIISITLISFVIPASAQQISIGTPAAQTVEVHISEDGKVHVIHIVKQRNQVNQVTLVKGTMKNLKVVDEKGNEPQYANATLGSVLESITLFPRNSDVTIEYDLEDIGLEKIGETWSWYFYYKGSPILVFPEKVDLVFANEKPVKIDEMRGFKCHGCGVNIEYVLDEPIQKKIVQWEDREFIVEIRTLEEISSFSFDQPRRSISFDVNEGSQFVTLTIPLELLWKPYDVYLNEKNILKHEFYSNETHAMLNVKPKTAGTLLIIGYSVVPEFPILIPLFLGLTAVILIQLKYRISLR
jgi:hypothetical protein